MARERRGPTLVLLAAMIGIGPLGTNVYLPALPDLAADLGASGAESQLTLFVYLMGMGAGQLCWGPLSDRFGRRRPLLVGLAAFAAVGALSALAPTMEALLVARALQGACASAGLVIARSVARDLYEGPELRRIFGLLALVFGVAPLIGPLAGAWIMQVTDWRGPLWALVGLGVVVLVLTAAFLPETLTDDRRLDGGAAAGLDALLAPLRNRMFITNALLMLLALIAMFSYVAYIPFILQTERGLDDIAFAWLFALNGLAVLAGAQVAALLARRVSGPTVVWVAFAIALVSASVVLLALVLDWPTWILMTGLWITTLQTATIQPTAVALAISPFARGAGTASAIAGGIQFLGGALIAAGISAVLGSQGIAMGVTLVGATTLGLVIALVGRRTTTAPAAPAATPAPPERGI